MMAVIENTGYTHCTKNTGCEIRHLIQTDCAPIFKYIGKRQVDKMNEKIGTDNHIW